MSSTGAVLSPTERLDVLFGELAELAGQRNAIDGRIVEIVAEVDRDGLWGATGARSVAGLVAWKLGTSEGNAKTITTVAQRSAAFPRCVGQLQQGRLSLDQVGVIAARAGEGSDEHYAQLASVATVNQLRTAIKLEPRPDPDPHPQPQASITKNTDEHVTWWRIKLPHAQAATLDAAINAHREALITDWNQAHGDASQAGPPMPGDLEAFLRRLVPEGDRLYRHTTEGPDDMPAHVKSALTATQLSVPIVDGALALGTWQAVYVFEHRAVPHVRELVLHLVGE